MNEIVSQLVPRLDERQYEEFEERAAITEFDAGFSRDHAECLAMLEVVCRYPELLSGVIALRLERDGETHWLLTTDVRTARHHLNKVGPPEIVTTCLRSVIEEHFSGAVLIAAES